jgi:hypothetical protein
VRCIAQIQFAGTNPIYLNATELPVNWPPSGRLEKRGKPGGAARGAHALLLNRPLLLRRIQVSYLPELANLICTACKSDLCGRKMSPQVQERPERIAAEASIAGPASSHTTTRGETSRNSFLNQFNSSSGRPSPPVRSRPPSACCCPASWPSTPCPRGPRPLPSSCRAPPEVIPDSPC